MPHLIFLLCLLLLAFPTHSVPSENDTNALTLFRLQTDTHGSLLSNWTGPNACSPQLWQGVKCSSSGRHVVGLALPSLSLRGPLTALSSLPYLRLLDLHDNRLNGTLSPLTTCTNLKLVYLSENDLSGPIPPEISSLTSLLRVDISNNNFEGNIPWSSLTNLTRLITLRLQDNELSGPIPDTLSSSFPHLSQLNLSNNQLSGPIPDKVLNKFGERSFSGNVGLCGPGPLPACSSTVPSSPSSIPNNVTLNPRKRNSGGLSPGAIVAISISACVGVLIAASFLVAHCCGGTNRESNSKVGSEAEGKKRRSNGSFSCESDGTEKSRLVFYEAKEFELEDLLKASAEMLGKGSLGTVYKAVLEDGSTVAVKRLKDANPCGRREFEQYMEVIGKMKHVNVVRFRAYYYAKEEKLLVFDYLPNANLYFLLHGNRGPGRIPLDWTTRISLVLGAARGLAKIHQQYNAAKIPHGNIKSSNVLLDKNGVACISDFGLSLLLNPAHAIARLGGYKAPEQSETKKLSQKADVYSFGVLLLEVLTGRVPSQHPSPCVDEEEPQEMDLPKWVRSVVKEEWTGEVFDQELLRYKNIEEELVSMLHVGLACVAPQPEKRPTMVEVVKMIEDIRVEQSPLGEDYDESRNSLSPSLATTEDGLAAF